MVVVLGGVLSPLESIGFGEESWRSVVVVPRRDHELVGDCILNGGAIWDHIVVH